MVQEFDWGDELLNDEFDVYFRALFFDRFSGL
jgi:hypothetical protein